MMELVSICRNFTLTV